MIGECCKVLLKNENFFQLKNILKGFKERSWEVTRPFWFRWCEASAGQPNENPIIPNSPGQCSANKSLFEETSRWCFIRVNIFVQLHHNKRYPNVPGEIKESILVNYKDFNHFSLSFLPNFDSKPTYFEYFIFYLNILLHFL